MERIWIHIDGFEKVPALLFVAGIGAGLALGTIGN